MEEENVVNPKGVSNEIPYPIIPNNPGNQVPGELPSAREAFAKLAEQNRFTGAQNIPISSFYSGGNRYGKTRPFTNFEEMAAQKQSGFDQVRNGLGKAVGIAGTSFISGTVGLLNGIGSSIANQQFSKLYDNPTTQFMDRLQKGMEDYAPNYYRQAETDAEWWQSDNLLTPNFWADKVIKNIGYGIGSIAGGAAWTKAFKLVGKANALVKLGKGAETAATIEKAMQVVPRAQKISAIEGALGNLSQGIKSQITNNGQRTLTSVMGTFGEASIESLQKSNEFRDNAIAEFRSQNGIDPTGKDLDDINAFAEKAGNYVWGMNTILLTASNYIQLPKILGSSRKVEKAFINDLTQKGLGKEFIEKTAKTRFGKIVDTTKGLGRFFIQPTEAAEEGMQFAIASGVDDYFNRAYTNREDLGTFLETISGAMGNVFGEGIDKTLSTKEGIESILIGSLAGGIQQAPMSIYREGLTGKGGQRKRNTDIALKQLNETNIAASLKDQANFLAVGIGSQTMRQQAIENNDILSEKDYEADYSLSYLMPRAKYGKMENVYEELEYYKEQALNPQGFAELQTAGVAFEKESPAQFVQRIGNLENTAKAVQKHYDNINETYAGVFKTDADGKIIEDAKGRPIRKYNPVVVDKLVYAASKIDDYSARIPGLTSVLSSAGINISTILNDVLVSEKPTIEAVKESIDQINAMDVVSDVKDNLKRSLSDLIEMSLRRKVFIDDYNDIKKNPEVFEAFSRAERFREKGPVDVTQQEGGKSVVKTLKVGQEYSLAEPIRLENGKITLAPKFTIISETLGGEFEVRLPNGKEVFLSPLEFKTYNISEEDNTSQEFENALNQSIDDVLQYPAFRDVIEKPGEKVNKLAYINSLGNQKLSEAVVNRFKRLTKDIVELKAKQKEVDNKIKEQSSDINSQQDEEAQASTDPKVELIPFDTRIDTGETGPLKSAARFFNASSNESDDPNYKYYNPNPSPHIIRARVFLNNAKSNKNRDKFRAITFTYNQENDLGLSGVTQLSYGANWETQKGTVNDLIDGFIAQVYVEVDGKNRYFIDQNGNRIKGADGKDVKVGQQVDLGKVVFETRPTAREYNSDNSDRFRTRQKEEFMDNMETWKQQREILLGNPAKQMAPMAAKDLPTNSFMISKGFPLITEKVDGKYVKNKVGDTLITESQIETQSGLLKISTGTPIVHSGENMNAKPGIVYLQDRDMLQVLNNNLLGAKKGKSVYEVIKSLINDMQQQAADDKPIQLDRQKLKYLGSVMIYARPTKDMLNNQLWIDIDSMSVMLGNNSYSFSDFLKNEADVIKAFSSVYHSANKRLLDKAEPHYEFVFKDGKLDFVKWPNYQSYLLSGTDRSVDEVPFVTNVRKKSDALPYNFRGKYAYISNFTVGEKNTNFTAPEAQEEKAPVAPPIESKSESNSPSEVAEALPVLNVGGFTLNNGSTNIVEVSKQPIEFIGTVNEKGQIKVDLDFRTEANQKSFENVAAVISEETLNTYRAAIPQLNESSSKEDTIVEFFRYQITAKINKALKAQQEASAPAAPVVPASDIEAKKFDIESLFSINAQSIIDNKADILSNPTKYETTQTVGNVTTEQTVDVSKGNITVIQRISSNDKSISFSNRIYLSSKGEVSSIISREGGISFFKDKSGVVNEEAKLKMVNLAETVKNYFPEIFSKIEEYAKKYKGFVTSTDNFRETVRQTKFIDAFDSFLYNKDLLSDADFARITLHNAELAALEGAASTEQVSSKQVELDQYLENVDYRPQSLDLVVSNSGVDKYTVIEAAKNVEEASNKKYGFGSIIHTLKVTGGNLNYPNTTKPERERIRLYNEELAKLTGKPVEQPTPPAQQPAAEAPPKSNKGKFKSGYSDTRAVSKGELFAERISDRDIKAFKKWHAEKVPFIPYEILEQIYKSLDGIVAWGVFEGGVAKFFKRGLRGTEYHEIFEAIWKGFLSESERAALIDEFKNRPGYFLDRESGQQIAFSEATDRQVKERIADDFADYRLGKLPARTLSEKIKRFFNAIIEFFKSFVNNPSLKQQLFDEIEAGRFKESVLPDYVKTAQPEYRPVMKLPDGAILSEDEAYNIVQDMVISTSGYLLNRGNDDTVANVFNIKGVTGTEVYNFIRNIYEGTGNLQALGDKLFNELFLRSVDNLRPLGVNIDTDSLISVNDEQGNNRLYSPEAFEVDLMKNASFAIKYILATLPSASKSELDPETGLPALKTGAVGLPVLSNFNRTFATLLSKLSNTPISKIPAKLMELYKNDGNYYRVARSLNGNMSAEDAEELFDFGNFTDNDWRLYIQFVQAFNKSRPDATVEERTASPEGVSVITKPADKSSAINVQKYNWLSNIKVLGRQGGSIIDQKNQNFFIDTEHSKYPKKRPSTNTERLEFLANIGITFPGAAISNKDEFVDAVNRIYEYGSKNLANFKKFLGADSSITKLAVMYVDSLNPDQDTTRFNVENKRTGNYSDSNAVSVFEEDFNDAQTLDELFKKRPELKDAFSQNSLIIKKGGLFFDKEGNKIKGKILKIGVVDGISEEDGGTTVSGLTEGERFSVEINQNVKGNYYILVPADSATERTYNIGNQIKFENTNTEIGDSEFFDIMRSYLDDEINLALDWRNRSKLSAVGDRAKELRFFKEILSPSLVKSIEGVIAKTKLSKEKALAEISKILSDNKSEVESSIRETIAYQNDKLNKALTSTGEVSQVDENSVDFSYLDSEFAEKNKIDKNKISNEDYNKFLSFLNMNQMISNIELHKFIFGDPYQFEVKNGNLEETKRIKSWLSPRRKTFDSEAANDFLNKKYNKVTDDIVLSGNDITRHNFNSYVKTVTLTDPTPQSRYLNSFGNYKESDGFSLIGIGTFREVKWKNAEWPKEAENWYQWQMAYTRQKLSKIKKADGKFVYNYGKNSALQNHDAALIQKPEPYYVLEVLKPIVSGAKPELGRIEGTIDKFSQMPLFFKAIEGTHLQDLYTQMLEEGVGYVVYRSGRKEGVRDTHNVYNGNGTFNSSNFGGNTIENVAWSTYGIQVENSYEEGKQQTRGSQPMKNASLDMFQYGKSVMDGAQELYDDITKTHDEFHQFQYEKFLENLGIEDLGDLYRIKDAKKVSQTLEYELLRREASENVIDTIRLNENGQFGIPFEASSAYEDIRSVLFSIINKSLISPPMEGKPHVQVAATLWENRDKGRRILRKTKDGYVEISKDEYEKLSDENKKGVVLSSDTLKFYEDKPGERHIEVMIPNFWKRYFKGMSDEQILEYLNKPENQKILFGIGFRIPHQAASSTEVFKVKGFLHPSMGSTVVVPSEIVQKAGSDFDIDKLNMYLKAVYVDQNGDVKLIEYKGSKKATMDFYAKVYDEQIKNEIEDIEAGDEFRNNLIEVFEILESIEDPSSMTGEALKSLLGDKLSKFYTKKQQTINNIINVALSKKQRPSDYIGDQVGRMADKYAKLTEKQLSESMKKDFVDLMYKKSLENRYFELLQEIVTLPENFERLLTPVGDANLPEVAKELDKARQDEEATFKNKLLSKTFLTSLRHAFLLGKKWVGIAAVNITGHSIAQKINAYLDPRRLNDIDAYDASFLGDMSLAVPHNTVEVDGQKMIALGGRTTAYSKKDKEGKSVFEFISDRLSGYATAFVDVAKDPYIMKILRSDLVVSTAMFMERIGVGELTPYFLNQPIIIDYLKYLDRIGSRSLFSKNNIAEIDAMYPIEFGKSYNLKQDFVIDESTGLVDFEKSKANLLSSIDITAERNDEFNLKQRAVLNEFLRLSKMGQFSFKFTQAYNYDTTRVRTTESVLRKVARTEAAEEKNIISSINDVFKQTFIGDQKRLIIEEVKALSAIFKLDADVFYSVIDEVMKPFVNDEYMSIDDFDRVARKVKTSFIDYLTQNKSTRFSKEIIDDLVIGKNNIAVQLAKLQDKYASSELLSNLEPRFSNHEGGAVTVSLKVKPKDAASVNRYIGLMRELKSYEPEFYNNLLLVNLLQGTYETKININKVIPLEDRAEIIAPVISSNYSFENIKDFSRNGAFFRTNFSDDKVVPFFSPRYNVTEGNIDYKSSGFATMKEIGAKPGNGKVLRLSKKYDKFNHSNMDFLKVTRYQYARGYIIDITGEKNPMSYDNFKKLVLNGELSKSEIVGYQKVKDLAGAPLEDEKGNTYFKMVNLYGDGDLVKIYKTNGLPSAINNNTYKVDKEIQNSDIIAFVNNEVINPLETAEKIDVAAELAPVPEVATPITSKVERTTRMINRSELRANPKTLYLFGDNDSRKGLGGQAKEMRNEPNAIGISTKKLPASSEQSYKTDAELDVNKKIIKDDIDKAIAAWSTGKYNKLIIPQLGVGLAELPTRAPQTYEFLQQELQRLENYINGVQEAATPVEEVEEVEFTTTKLFKYFGRFYNIVIDQDGKAIDVEGYKGKEDAKQKLLDAYKANPNVDPQSNKPFFAEDAFIEEEEAPEVVSGNSFKFEDGTVINTGNITLNEQQKEALQLAVNAIKKNQTKFVLRGYAGTGKSTISKFVREYLQNSKSFKDVSYASPTHKANTNLLIQLLRGKVFNTMPFTTASLLNKIKGEDGDFIAGPKDKMPYSGVLIVDESSMIDAQDYNLLMGLAKRKGTTVIFMGDPAQLPPVGSSQLSKALQFSSSEDGVELTQVMRQQGDNPLLDILTNIRQNLTTVVDRFSFSTNVNGRGEGVEFTNDYLSFNDKMLQYFKSPEYKEDPTYAKVLTYTNASVANYNNLIQSQLGLSPYGVGSIMMGYEQVGQTPNVHNGQDYKILESQYITDRDVKVFDGNVGNKYFNIEEKVSGYKVQMRRVFSKEDEQLLNDTGQTALLRPLDVFIINPNDDRNLKFMERVLAFKKVLNDKTIPWKLRQDPLNQFESFFNTYQLPADMISYKGKITTLPKLKQENPELFKVNRQTGKTLFEETATSERPMLAKNIDYGYAVTSHKGQGSTYQYVFDDYENMENPANNRVISDGDVKYAIERQQLKYVGLSRASKIAFVFTRKAGTDELYSSQEIQSEPSYIPESQESFVPWSIESEGQASGVRSFYESLTPDQKLKLGSLQDIISEYNELPTEISERTFIEMLMCRL
jgi:exodeoxyribonuclease-5